MLFLIYNCKFYYKYSRIVSINFRNRLFHKSIINQLSNGDNVKTVKLTKIDDKICDNQNKSNKTSTIIQGKIDYNEIIIKDESRKLSKKLKNIGEKNFLLREILTRPVSIAEWYESSREEKIDRFVYDLTFYVVFVTGVILIHMLYLFSLIEKHEITDRDYIKIISDTINELYEQLLLNDLTDRYSGKFLSSSNEQIKLCDKILNKIIEANKDFIITDDKDGDTNDKSNLTWSTIIIDCDTYESYVINTQRFIIFSKKLIDLCDNDEHQLAYLLSHQLSHGLLKHYREPFSNLTLKQIWTGLKLLYYNRFMWFFEPNEWIREQFSKSFPPFVQYDEWIRDLSYRKYRNLLAKLFNSQIIEQETDRIALQLFQRCCCYDIHRINKFINKCHIELTELNQELNQDELNHLYKHCYYNYNDDKLNQFNDKKFIEKFIKFFNECGCDPS